MRYDFARGSGWREHFTETYSIVAGSARERFLQKDGWIENSALGDGKHFAYISAAYGEKLSVGASVSLDASFESYGAPLVTLANEITKDGAGYPFYGDHYEIVLYEGGCNVWYVKRAPQGSASPIAAENPLRLYFPIESGERVTLRVSTGIRRGVLTVELKDHRFEIPAPHLADTFYVGFTACEGINHLYAAEICE